MQGAGLLWKSGGRGFAEGAGKSDFTAFHRNNPHDSNASKQRVYGDSQDPYFLLRNPKVIEVCSTVQELLANRKILLLRNRQLPACGKPDSGSTFVAASFAHWNNKIHTCIFRRVILQYLYPLNIASPFSAMRFSPFSCCWLPTLASSIMSSSHATTA